MKNLFPRLACGTGLNGSCRWWLALFCALLLGGMLWLVCVPHAGVIAQGSADVVKLSDGVQHHPPTSLDEKSAIDAESMTELMVDDGGFEGALRSTRSEPESYVNRLSPPSYPATLTGVSLFFPNSAPPLGTPITLLVGSKAAGDANLDNINFQTLPATIQRKGEFVTYDFPAFTITSGDFIVGFQTSSTSGQFPAALDTTPPARQRSYIAIHGLAFLLTDNLGANFVGNLGIRARLAPAQQNPFLYVLNNDTGGDRIYGYAVNETTGALTLLPGFPVVTGGNGDAATVSERLTIDRTNLRLYAVDGGVSRVSAYSINPMTGALSPLIFSPIVLGGGFFTAIGVHPSGSPLLVGSDTRLLSFQINATSANPAPSSPFTMLTESPFSIAFSQDGKYVYLKGRGNSLAALSVEAANGVMIPLVGSPFDVGISPPTSLATDAQGRIFMAHSGGGQARVFTTANGAPTAVTGNPFNSGLTQAVHGLLHPNGFYVAADRLGNRVGVYRISGSGSGTTLTAVPGSPFASGGLLTDALALDQSGMFLFAANGDSRNLTTFSVNPTTGVLTALSTQPVNTLGASGRLVGMAYLGSQCPTISLSPSTLPSGTIGIAYSQTITASPSGNYTFTISAGALPAGLSFNSATGAITGTPTAAGTANFTITALGAGGCNGSQAYTLNINNPVPLLTSLNPSSAVQGAAGFTLTISGTGFVPNAVLRWNGADRPTTFVSNTHLTAAIPASDLAASGAASVTVFNPTPGGGSSNALSFTIFFPVPTISDFNPRSAIAGGSGFTLTVTGTGFLPGAVLQWFGASRPTTFISSTQLTAQIPASDIVAAGTAVITVTNPPPGNTTSNADVFTINNPVPTITGLSPSSAVAGGPAFTLTVTGTNFVPASSASWNGAPRGTTFVSSTQLTVAISAADIRNVGTSNLAITNPAPGGGASAAQTFNINSLVPTLTALNPSSIAAGGPAFVLNVTGTNFVNGSVLRWNGINRTTTFFSATRLIADISPPDIATAGTARVTVVNPAPGGGTSNELTVTIANAVASVSAASFLGTELAAESIVSAFGIGLATSTTIADTTPLPTTLAGTTVKVRDSAGVELLAPLFFVSPSQINYLLPAGTATGTATITVTSGNGTLSVGTVQIAQVAPGLFTANASGQGIPAAVVLRVKADGTQINEPVAQFNAAMGRFVAVPIDLRPEGEQVFLILFGTGFRAVSALTNVTARIGGANAEVLFAGSQGLAGLDQANLRIPRSLAGRGEVEVVLMVEGKAANTVRINIK